MTFWNNYTFENDKEMKCWYLIRLLVYLLQKINFRLTHIFVRNSSHKNRQLVFLMLAKPPFGSRSGTTCRVILMFGRLSTISIYEISHSLTFYDTCLKAERLDKLCYQFLNRRNKFLSIMVAFFSSNYHFIWK